MQLLKAFFFIGILAIVSCNNVDYYDASDYDQTLVILEDLELDQETISFLDIYQATDKITMKRVLDESIIQSDLSSPELYPHNITLDTESNYSEDDYWILDKVSPLTTSYDEEVSTWKGNYQGELEKQEILFRDKNNNSLKLEASISAYIWLGNWKIRSMNFIVNFDEDCPVVYINQRTQGPTDSGKRVTITLDKMQIGSKTYFDVMRLRNIASFAHYTFYATKAEGIIRIDDYHNENIWVLAADF